MIVGREVTNMKRWGEKRYYSLDYYIKEAFGEKLYKLSLDGGMTCPNRDGKLGVRGCIFCSAGGSGDFAGDRRLSIKEQLSQAKQLVKKKHTGSSYIAYFQAYTNTYAPVDYLEKIFMEAISEPDIKVLSIATRPDCLSQEILELLSHLNKIKPVWIELGLQTSHKESADFIRRGYDLDVFEKAVYDLKNIGISVITHVILCLPGETSEMMLETISYLNNLPIDGIKLQLLHVLQGTDLAKVYEATPFYLPNPDEYLELLGKIISHLREDIVIHRLTGDGPKSLLIAPLWTGNKRLILNRIQKHFKDADIWQGKEISCQNHLHSTN
jgi:radical SAM protein (TIGR01212 family)